MINLNKYNEQNTELIVCMTDTILRLESKEQVSLLFNKSFKALEEKAGLY